MNTSFEKTMVEIGKGIYHEILPSLEKDFNENHHVFLIGAAASNNNSLRSRVHCLLSSNKKVRIHYPEDIFKDQIYQNSYDLLSLENLLANSVHAIVMCIESHGAIAELGAFSNHNKLNNKLILLMDENRKREDSFINLGPVKFLKNKTKSFINWINYEGEIKNSELVKESLLQNIKTIKKSTSIFVDLNNPLFSEKYLLTLLYAFGSLERKQIINIIKEIGIGKNKDEINYYITLVDCALGILSSNKQILKDSNHFYLSNEGRNRIFTEFSPKIIHAYLDNIRFKMLNLKLRKYWEKDA